MIQKRLQEEDCNAGAMFDSLSPSENWPDDKFAISAIFEACGRQNVQVVLFTHLKEKPQEYEADAKYDVCVNYRYASRHDPIHLKSADLEPVKTKEKAADAKKAPVVKVAKSASVKGKNAPAKKEAKIEAEPEAKTVNPEAEKKAKDLEAKRKRAENLARQGLKLPSYSGADKDEWGKKADDYSAFINELIQNSANAEVGFRKINE